jgi:hypothetical protein
VAFANAVDCSKFVAYHETGDDRRSAICSIVCSRFGRLMLRAPTRKSSVGSAREVPDRGRLRHPLDVNAMATSARNQPQPVSAKAAAISRIRG